MAWAPNYTDPESLAAYTRIGDTADDVQLSLAIAASSRAIDRRCCRQFGQLAAVAAREYVARWSRARNGWIVPIDDLMTSTGLIVKTDTAGDSTFATTVTDYQLRPVNAAGDGWPWTALLLDSTAVVTYTAVQVTARWGWTAIPPTIEQACLLQASRLLSRRDSPFGIAGSPEAGSELRLLSRLDADVVIAVEPYRRRTWAR